MRIRTAFRETWSLFQQCLKIHQTQQGGVRHDNGNLKRGSKPTALGCGPESQTCLLTTQFPQNSTPSFSPPKKHPGLSSHMGMLTADHGQSAGCKVSPPSQPLRKQRVCSYICRMISRMLGASICAQWLYLCLPFCF